jgi:hypothetical protein
VPAADRADPASVGYRTVTFAVMFLPSIGEPAPRAPGLPAT